MTHWAASIEAQAEPALLSRILQRLMVQGAVIDSLCYRTGLDGISVRIEIVFEVDEERARLLARRWETVVTVERVQLCAARVFRRESRG